MDSIVISKAKDSTSCFDVTVGDKTADHLTYDETLGLISVLLMKQMSFWPCTGWLKTEIEKKAWEDSLKSKDVEHE